MNSDMNQDQNPTVIACRLPGCYARCASREAFVDHLSDAHNVFDLAVTLLGDEMAIGEHR